MTDDELEKKIEKQVREATNPEMPSLLLSFFPEPAPSRGPINNQTPEFRAYMARKVIWQKAQKRFQQAVIVAREMLGQSSKAGSEDNPAAINIDQKLYVDKPPASHDQNVQWAYDNLANGKVKPEDAPSSTAYLIWHNGRTDPAFAKNVIIATVGKRSGEADVDKLQLAIEDEQRKSDAELSKLITRIERSLENDKNRNDRSGVRAKAEGRIPGPDPGESSRGVGSALGGFDGHANSHVPVGDVQEQAGR